MLGSQNRISGKTPIGQRDRHQPPTQGRVVHRYADSEEMAEFLMRISAVRDLLDDLLWAQAQPMQATDVAIEGLQSARSALKQAGFCESADS